MTKHSNDAPANLARWERTQQRLTFLFWLFLTLFLTGSITVAVLVCRS